VFRSIDQRLARVILVVEESLRAVVKILLGRCWRIALVGTFHKDAVDERVPGADQGDQMGSV
jgi:hypothetical protein